MGVDLGGLQGHARLAFPLGAAVGGALLASWLAFPLARRRILRR